MKKQFTDTHVQVESGNDIFGGVPRQVVRREFEQGVVWFEKPIYTDENMSRIDRSKSEIMEQRFAETFGKTARRIVTPQNF